MEHVKLLHCKVFWKGNNQLKGISCCMNEQKSIKLLKNFVEAVLLSACYGKYRKHIVITYTSCYERNINCYAHNINCNKMTDDANDCYNEVQCYSKDFLIIIILSEILMQKVNCVQRFCN